MPYFVFTDGRDTFVVQLKDRALIQHARDLIAGTTEDAARVGGKVTEAPADYNIGWSYRLDPQDVTFYDTSAEVADATISAVEAFVRAGGDLERFLPHKMWLSWGTSMVAELRQVTGTSGADSLKGISKPDIVFGYGGNDVLHGAGGDDHLIGGAGLDQLFGDSGADKLSGGDGSDRLDGGEGADVMMGGSGGDLFIVDNAGDRVLEAPGGGFDTVRASVDYTVPVGVERLILTGTAAIDARGNAGANAITGNSAANRINGFGGNDVLDGGGGDDSLYGELGSDTLTGGAGADAFQFRTALGVDNVDTVTDFESGSDRIFLKSSVFAEAGPAGTLAASAFHEGSAAAEADDRILYDSATGSLFYDPDGTGEAAAVLFATVGIGTAISASDFVVFG
ncbi:MAG TPA: calcium-binding protein [Allosphingosinicella sp.]|jgi:Ca2+-binding RTX toxin-like protein|nr:calcium-binding protein [Allosphingosinicella sp.]